MLTRVLAGRAQACPDALPPQGCQVGRRSCVTPLPLLGRQQVHCEQIASSKAMLPVNQCESKNGVCPMCPDGVDAVHNGRETLGNGLPQQAARASLQKAGL